MHSRYFEKKSKTTIRKGPKLRDRLKFNTLVKPVGKQKKHPRGKQGVGKRGINMDPAAGRGGPLKVTPIRFCLLSPGLFSTLLKDFSQSRKINFCLTYR